MNIRTHKSTVRSFRFVAVLLLALFSMTILPMTPQASAEAQGVSSQKALREKYFFKQGADSGQGFFINTYKVGKDVYKQKMGVMCEATSSSKPYFILSYQFFVDGKPFTTKQQATVHASKRVNKICKVTDKGVLVIRDKAINSPKATFKYLFEIALDKDIIPMQ